MRHDVPLIEFSFLVMKLNEETPFANYVRVLKWKGSL